MADTRGLTLIRMHALKKKPCLPAHLHNAGWQPREGSDKRGEKKPLSSSPVYRPVKAQTALISTEFGVAFLIVYPPPACTHTLILHLAGNDIKASLLLAEMERRSFSISNRASFLCFENGMFNTMKSLSPAPSLSVMGSKLQRGALFMGRLVCAGMRTKEGRKLALECHAGEDQGLGFQQSQPRTRAQGSPSEPQPGRQLLRGVSTRDFTGTISQMSTATWTRFFHATFQFL